LTLSRRSAFLAVAFAVFLLGCTEESADLSPAVTAGTLSVFEAELFYQTIGDGQPVVVLHGGPGLDHTYLRPWFEPLAKTHQVIFYDQRGLGGSRAQLNISSISMSRYLTDLDRIRERVAQRERIIVLTHSWGAIPALLYALQVPNRVEALILVSPVEPGSRFSSLTSDRQVAKRAPADQRALDSLRASPQFRAGDSETINRLFFHVFRGTFANPGVADSLLAINLQPRTVEQGQEVARLLMAPLEGLDFWDELEQLQVPVLIVHGESDPVPVEMVELLHETLPESNLVLLKNTGHFPFIENRVEFFGAVRQFLSGLGP
jgi:proline iminopeptidase